MRVRSEGAGRVECTGWLSACAGLVLVGRSEQGCSTISRNERCGQSTDDAPDVKGKLAG